MCENCLRDQALIAKLRETGHEVIAVPIYLPMPDAPGNGETQTAPFYGAVRVFLEHRFPAFKHAPQKLKRWLDSTHVLRLAGRFAGTSSSKNLGGLTLSVLRGEHGGQASELETLCNWIRDTQKKPDIIHLSNALLLGMARRLKAVLNVPIVCSLQDEDTWIDAMPGRTASLIWTEIRDRISDIAGFVTASHFYANKLPPRLMIPPCRVRVIPPGIDASRYPPATRPGMPAWNVLLDPDDLDALGFILQAFADAKQHPSCRGLHLHCSGISRRKNRLAHALLRPMSDALRNDVRLSPLILSENERLAFIQSASVFTVLHRSDVAFDLSVLEAMAYGVPVVQPNSGANPEILATAEGGVLFEPRHTDALTKALVTLFNDPSRLLAFAQRGRQDTATRFSIDRMAQDTLAAYEMLSAREN